MLALYISPTEYDMATMSEDKYTQIYKKHVCDEADTEYIEGIIVKIFPEILKE